MHCLHSASKETVTWLGPGAPPEPRCRQDTSGCPPEYIGHRQSMVFPKQKWGAIPRRWQHTRLSLLETSSRRCPGLWAAGSPPSRPRSTCTLPRPSPKAPHSLPAGDQEAVQPHLGGDLPLLLGPPSDQQPHLLHCRAGKGPLPRPERTWALRAAGGSGQGWVWPQGMFLGGPWPHCCRLAFPQDSALVFP